MKIKIRSVENKDNKPFIIFLIIMFLSGCASKPAPIKSMPRSDDFRYKPAAEIVSATKIKQQNQVAGIQKSNNLIILLDDGVKDQQSLNETLKNLLSALPKNIQSRKKIKHFGLNNHTKDTLMSLTSELIFYTNNNNSEKNTDIIILTQWKQINNQSIRAAEQLLIKSNQKFCLHLIGIGNIHQNKRLIKPQYCGSSASSESLLSVNKLKQFISNIITNDPLDSDRDGIYDKDDKCPYTPLDTIITWNGCARNSQNSNPRYLILSKQRINKF